MTDDESQSSAGPADLPTSKQKRVVDFDETDTFSSLEGPREPPPPGSLAAWLASNQEAATPPPGRRPERKRGAAGKAGADPNRWWICCDPLPPIPLDPSSATITLGRSPAADVVLPHSQVSRVHGKIKVLGPGFYRYEDNGSSNGSILNGEKADKARLQVGDVLTLGPYEIEIHSHETLEKRQKARPNEEELEGDHTRVVENTPQAAMTGRLNEVPITEILQGLEFNRKTGTLQIQSKAGKGRLTVAEGHPIQAKFAELHHDEALIAIALLSEGSFQFSASVEPAEPMFRATITGCLLEATRRQDEGA